MNEAREGLTEVQAQDEGFDGDVGIEADVSAGVDGHPGEDPDAGQPGGTGEGTPDAPEDAPAPAPGTDAEAEEHGDSAARAERITHGEEADRLREVYPWCDPEREMQDPAFRALALGEVRPTLRQVFELLHASEIFGGASGAGAVPASEAASVPAPAAASVTAEASAPASAPASEPASAPAPAPASVPAPSPSDLEAAVAEAVAQAEARLLQSIQARGMRPVENGLSASGGVRMHPAVGRLTRSERAELARLAERGEHIPL